MGIIAFNLSLVEDLAEKTLKGTSFSPTMDMLFDKKYYHGNVIKDKDGKTQEEVEAEGGHFWPCQTHIDKTLVEPVLQLVGDQGCYLISNFDNGKSPNESGMIVYADGMNPDIDEDYYELKREKFGGDDGSVTIPIEWVAIARQRKSRKFRVNLTATSVSLK
jgi:hypothetical protein